MRIVCLSDTHSRHDGINVPQGDVLVHAGDSTMAGRVEEIARFNHWLGAQPHRHKIVIAGNHDLLFESDPGLAESLITNAVYLRDDGLKIEGVRFYGSPWQPWFMDWAFNLRRGAEIRSKWNLIPEGTDVLITHGPPHGILDLVPLGGRGENENAGCEELKAAVKRIKPQAHIFGHIHEGYGLHRGPETVYVNASVCDSDYRPVNEPMVVEVDARKVEAVPSSPNTSPVPFSH
jgi:Icc-related predicted phosphoesterase